MLKFLRGNKIKADDQSEEKDASDILNTIGEGEEELETELSIPKSWNLTEEEQYVYAFHNTQSPKLKKNQISIYGMELLRESVSEIKITGLIRSTVEKSIQFEKATIILLNGNKEGIARKEFDLSKLGTLPTNSARPWEFVFQQDDFLRDVNEPINNWSLAFELKQPHRLDLAESWEKSIANETLEALERIVQDAPELKPDEVNFMGIQARKDDEGQLAVTLLIRNGSDKNINLEQIPLGVRDASNEEVARGSFKLDDFEVKANTSKPWTFIFPKSMVKKEDIDFSKWAAYVIQE